MRLVWLFPQPVRVAQTATTGFDECEHRRVRPHQPEVGARGEDDRRLVHHDLVLEVGVAEDDLVDVELADQLTQLLLGADRDPLRIARPGQRGRIDALVDAGDLGRREGDDVGVRVVAEGDVEVVEVASSGSHDDDLAHCGLLSGVGAPFDAGAPMRCVQLTPAGTRVSMSSCGTGSVTKVRRRRCWSKSGSISTGFGVWRHFIQM